MYETQIALRALYLGVNGGDERLDPAQESARLNRARAELAETDLAQRRGDLVAVDEVAEAWGNQISIAKNRLLSLPSRLAYDLLDKHEPRDVERTLRKAITAVLHELAGDD